MLVLQNLFILDRNSWYGNASGDGVNSTYILDLHPTNATGNDNFQPFRHLSIPGQILITIFYAFGISVNICSLFLLSKGETIRNKKQTLMVKCLVCNDLVALVGSFFLMYIQLYMKLTSRWVCALRVILRTFGLSSGCVAIVMAIERWLALTRPFFYQKQVTYKKIKRAIFSLWLIVLVLVCLPFLGFGLYYRDQTSECIKYRFAVETKDIAYAYIMFTFGLLLCVVIVCCNLAVVRVLCRMGKRNLERLGRTTMRKDSNELSFNHTTPEEISFAKLMIMLCVFFVVCWLPQIATILMAQTLSQKHPLYRIADVCIALNFTLDPVVYVLSRRPHRKGLRKLLKPFCHFCWPQSNKDSSIRSNTQEISKSTKEVNQNSLNSSSIKECMNQKKDTLHNAITISLDRLKQSVL